MRVLLALIFSLMATAVQAQYRCNVGGEVVYQSTRCGTRGSVEPKGYELYVPGEAGATYVVLEIIKSPPDARLREVTTKRIGRAGHVSYSRRLYDCYYSQVKYLGSADTFEKLNASKPDAGMSSIVTGSTADYVGREACK